VDIGHIVGWISVASLAYAAVQAYIGRREFDARRAHGSDPDPVIGPALRRMGRSYWITAGIELGLAAVVGWFLTR
jgi:hypothetical protein